MKKISLHQTPHQVDLKEVMEWRESRQWHTYASSTIEMKRLQIEIGSDFWRVTHGKDTAYHGSLVGAVETYNKITKHPDEQNTIQDH